MLAHARGWGGGVHQEPRTGAGPRLAGNFGDSFAPLAFLVLSWGCSRQDIVKVSASQLLSPAPRRDVPAAGPRFPPPRTRPGPGNLTPQLLTHEAQTPRQAPPGPRARPRPPAPLPSSAAREPGCWIPSLRLVLHFHKRAALRRAEIAAAASPRGAPPRRAPSPAPAERAPGLPRGSAAGGEGEEGGGGGGRLRAVLLRGGERGWGGGRGAGTPLAAAGGFASPRAATRALPASPVAAGARRKEHGEGRGGRSGARRPERGAGRAQHSAAQPSRAVTPGWSTGRARAQRLLLRRRRQVKASESARRALPAGGGRGSVGCRLGRARAFGGWVVRAETRLLRLLPGRGRRSGVGGVCLPLGE